LSNSKPLKNSAICEACAAKLSDSFKVDYPIELHIHHHHHYDGYDNAEKGRNEKCYSPHHNSSVKSYESKDNNGKKIKIDRVKEKKLPSYPGDNNIAKAYFEFEAFRLEFIKKWCARASFKESRKDGDIRPVVLLRTNKTLNELKADIDTDKRLLAILAEDPERFSPKATKFRPIADPFKGVTKVSVSQPTAINSRTKSKTKVLRALGRLVDRLDHTVLTTSTPYSIDALAIASKEYQSIKDDPEETYRVRTYGYTDTCVYLAQNGSTQVKLRIPLTGMFILDLDGICIVVIQDKLDPKLAIKSYPVSPINYSTTSKGLLYRQSDIDAYNKLKKLK